MRQLFRRPSADGLKYTAQAPLVIEFGGLWTDLPGFAEANEGGGTILTAALAIYARGSTERSNGTSQGDFHSIQGGRHSHVEYDLGAPLAAGLGTSAAQTLLWLTLVKATIANTSDRKELAEKAWRVERELDISSGKAVHYGSALGGVNLIRVGKQVDVEPVKPTLPLIEDLERRLVLAYTGASRPSSEIVRAVQARIAEGGSEVMEALGRRRAVASEMRDALIAQDLDRFGALMNEDWQLHQVVAPESASDTVKHLVDQALKSGAIAAKPVGAGAGGCNLCLAADSREAGLASTLATAGARIIPFRFDWFGVHLKKDSGS